MNNLRLSALVLAIVAALAFVGCKKELPAGADHDHDHEQEAAPTNRIAVPDTVQKNLGIAFVKVERRRVAATLRVPGHFELLPDGRQELRSPIDGRAAVLVEPLAKVAAGTVLATIDSPSWRQLQQALNEHATQVRVDEARIAALQPLVEAHATHEESLRAAVAALTEREHGVRQAQASVGGQSRELADVQASLAQARAALAEAIEKRAETSADLATLQANVTAGRDRFRLAIDAAAAVTGLSAGALLEDGKDSRLPTWRTLAQIEVRATSAGVVDHIAIASGAWLEPGALVLTVSDLGRVRFRANGLQSDLPQLADGLTAAVVPAAGANGTGASPLPRLAGTLRVGAEADPMRRTIELFLVANESLPWARPGVAGFLEIETRGEAQRELAVPLAAVLQDGTERVLFRRNPADKDQVIRIEADLGIDDGRWVAIKSGLRDGDEVVLAGAYELMLASSGSASKGGHFHADGTFHEGKDK